jgi:hypothetical protein
MRILTTSDLSYVSGGDSWGGTPEGQTLYSVAYPSSSQTTIVSAQEINGILMAVDNPMGYSVGVLVNLYNCYKNSSSFKGMSPVQVLSSIASGCTE